MSHFRPRFSQDFQMLTFERLEELKENLRAALIDLDEIWNPDFALYLKSELRMVQAWIEFREAEHRLYHAKQILNSTSKEYDGDIEFRDKTRSRMRSEYS